MAHVVADITSIFISMDCALCFARGEERQDNTLRTAGQG